MGPTAAGGGDDEAAGGDRAGAVLLGFEIGPTEERRRLQD